MDIKKASINDLQRELKKRQEKLPNKIYEGDIITKQLKTVCNEYIAYHISDGYHLNGLKSYERAIFETAIETFYGNDIWDWICSI